MNDLDKLVDKLSGEIAYQQFDNTPATPRHSWPVLDRIVEAQQDVSQSSRFIADPRPWAQSNQPQAAASPVPSGPLAFMGLSGTGRGSAAPTMPAAVPPMAPSTGPALSNNGMTMRSENEQHNFQGHSSEKSASAPVQSDSSSSSLPWQKPAGQSPANFHSAPSNNTISQPSRDVRADLQPSPQNITSAPGTDDRIDSKPSGFLSSIFGGGQSRRTDPDPAAVAPRPALSLPLTDPQPSYSSAPAPHFAGVQAASQHSAAAPQLGNQPTANGSFLSRYKNSGVSEPVETSRPNEANPASLTDVFARLRQPSR